LSSAPRMVEPPVLMTPSLPAFRSSELRAVGESFT
jgi:hypothetical protein